MPSLGYSGPERHRVTYSHCAGTEIAMIKEGIETYRPCAATFVAQVTAFGCRDHVQWLNLGPVKGVFESDAGSWEASGLEVFHILGQKVPRCQLEDANDFAVVNVGDFRNLEKVNGLIDRLVGSFPHLGVHRI